MSKGSRFLRVLLGFSRGAFGLENNCQNTTFRNSQDRCCSSKACVRTSSIADESGLSKSRLPCRFPSLPLLQRAAVGLKRVRWQGGKDVPAQATFHRGFSDGEMWLPAPSPSRGDALQAQSVKAIMSTCWAKPLWSCR